MSLPESLERAATNLANLADQIRPANGDPDQLLEALKPAGASEVLVWILANEPDVANELVSAWGEWEKGAEVLLGISDELMSSHGVAKAGRKILRKAHHRLRSRGIEVEPTVEPKVSPRRLDVVDDSFEAAYLSAPDFRGARVGYLAEGHPSGGARLFEIRFDEGRGILDFKVYNASRSKIRGFLRSMSVAQAQRLFDVPRLALCALARRASLAQPPDRPLPSAFMEWRGRIFSDSLESEQTPGALIRAELAEAGDALDAEAGMTEVVSLIGDGAVGPWPPPTTWVSDWMDKGRAQAEGLDGDALTTAIDAWRGQVTDALVAEDDRGLLSRHLEELAWVRRQTDGMAEAASLMSAADAILEEDWVHLRLSEARVESLFAPFLSELRGESGESSNDDAAEKTSAQAAQDVG